MSNCWDIKGCPASHYMSCQAYERGESCWEIKSGCLCRSYSDCSLCPIYGKYLQSTSTEDVADKTK